MPSGDGGVSDRGKAPRASLIVVGLLMVTLGLAGLSSSKTVAGYVVSGTVLVLAFFVMVVGSGLVSMRRAASRGG